MNKETVRFWRLAKEEMFNKIFISENASLSERTIYFVACKKLSEMGIGRDFSEHPQNPLAFVP